jgi:hypothetical protein
MRRDVGFAVCRPLIFLWVRQLKTKKWPRRGTGPKRNFDMHEINAPLGESKGNKNPVVSLTVEIGGELKTINFRRPSRGDADRTASTSMVPGRKSEGDVMKRRLRLVVDNMALNKLDAGTAEALFAAYRVALNRWHLSKSATDRLAARRAYNVWASSFLGERDSAAVKISSKRPWGFA